MRVIVFFDLPVKRKEHRAAATRFRNDLVREGYYMVQYSVYARLCNGIESANAHVARMQGFAPTTGSVRCMVVTEKQYAGMRIVSGQKKKQEAPAKAMQLFFL